MRVRIAISFETSPGRVENHRRIVAKDLSRAIFCNPPALPRFFLATEQLLSSSPARDREGERVPREQDLLRPAFARLPFLYGRAADAADCLLPARSRGGSPPCAGANSECVSLAVQSRGQLKDKDCSPGFDCKRADSNQALSTLQPGRSCNRCSPSECENPRCSRR